MGIRDQPESPGLRTDAAAALEEITIRAGLAERCPQIAVGVVIMAGEKKRQTIIRPILKPSAVQRVKGARVTVDRTAIGRRDYIPSAGVEDRAVELQLKGSGLIARQD